MINYIIKNWFGFFLNKTLIPIFISIVFSLSSQKIINQVNQFPVGNATIIFTTLNTNQLIGYSRSNTLGAFQIPTNLPDTCNLLVWHPNYLIYRNKWILNENREEVKIFPKNKVVREVLITANKAITMNGDTVSYIADSFKVPQDASVEDLLKKLPGIVVDKNGTIKAQGQEVTRVLVDGDDFFGADPSLATKNLDANMIAKVEVIDVANQETRQTGIDNGDKEKIINLKLKEAYKTGMFGKIQASASNTKRYDNKGLVQIYTPNTKASAYLIHNNMNNSLGWQERQNYMGGAGNWFYDENLDQWISPDGQNSIDDLGVIPIKIQGGGFLNHNWNEKESNFSVKYDMDYNNYNGGRFSNSIQSFDSTRIFRKTDNETIDQISEKQKFNINFNHKFDSFNTISAKTSLSKLFNPYQSSSNSILQNQNNFDTLNTNQNIQIGERNQTDISLEVSYRHNFRKPGQTFQITAMMLNDDHKNDFDNNSNLNVLENTGYQDSKISQNFTQKYNNNTIKTSALFTLPIYKKTWILEAGASSIHNNNQSDRITTNIFNGTLSDPIDSLSNRTSYRVSGYSESLKLNFVNKKIKVKVGATMNQIFLKQEAFNNNSLNRNFNFIQPYLIFNYTYAKNSNYKFSYIQSYNAPKIDQLQEFLNNQNPFERMVGNANLIPTKIHTWRTSFNLSRPFTNTYLWASSSFTLKENDIVNSSNIRENGVREITYINQNGNWNWNANANFSFKVPKTTVILNPNMYGGISRNNTFINEIKNINLRRNISLGLNIPIEIDSSWSGNFDFDASYTHNSIQSSSETNQKFWKYENRFDLTYSFLKTWKIGSNVSWNYYPAQSSFAQSQSIWLWNAELSKKISKKIPITLKFIAYDILAQNQNIQRFAWGNNITEMQQDRITRMFSFALEWRFKSKKSEKSDGN